MSAVRLFESYVSGMIEEGQDRPIQHLRERERKVSAGATMYVKMPAHSRLTACALSGAFHIIPVFPRDNGEPSISSRVQRRFHALGHGTDRLVKRILGRCSP